MSVKALIAKIRQLSIVYNCWTLRHATTRKCHQFRQAGTMHFHFMGEYLKLDTVKTTGTCGKINAI